MLFFQVLAVSPEEKCNVHDFHTQIYLQVMVSWPIMYTEYVTLYQMTQLVFIELSTIYIYKRYWESTSMQYKHYKTDGLI